MKVKIGKSRQATSQVRLDFDNNTTTSFGHCQPLMCRELVPDTTANVEVDSFVRLAPLVSPTFGRLKHKVWHTFVPIADIYAPFENLLAGQTYETSSSSYIPTVVPRMTLQELAKSVYNLDFYASAYMSLGPLSANSANNLVILPSGSTFVKVNYMCTSGTPWNSKNMYDYTDTNLTNNASGAYIYGGSSAIGHELGNSRFSILCTNGTYVPPFFSQLNGTPTPTNFDQVWEVATGDAGVPYVYYFQKLTARQRRLRKVLLGLGYTLDATSKTNVSILPLIAYYKAYFDTLVPERNGLTWSDTSAFKLMQRLEQYDYHTPLTNAVASLWYDFLIDLADTYYYDDADYVTAHIKSTSDVGTQNAFYYVDADGNKLSDISNTARSLVGPSNQPSLTVSDGDSIGAIQLKMLSILTKFVNKNTAIGGKIAEYLRVHYGADVENNLLNSNFIGGDSVDVTITDVMSNAMTSDATLGEYAGKGVGYKDGKNFKFKTSTFGYWITFAAVVPNSRFFQGCDPNLMHIDRDKFFMPEFDAVGFQISPRNLVYSNEGVYTSATTIDSTFGYIPRYSEYKTTAKNIVNGDMSLPSLKNSLMQYNLDKVLTMPTVLTDGDEDGDGIYSGVTVQSYDVTNLVADPYLREIGNSVALGNFNRIFYNAGSIDTEKWITAAGDFVSGLFVNAVNRDFFVSNFNVKDDNFIVHNIINVSATVPMIPISESFDTDGDDKDAITVDKA